MVEIAICEDEMNDLKAISKLVHDICRNEAMDNHLQIYSSGEKMLEQSYMVDIGLLDIAMNGINGIDLGRELKKRFPDVRLIYITNYEQYCRQVINRVHAFSFLTKPVVYEKMREQIIELLDDLENDTSGRKYEFHNVTANGRMVDVLQLNLKDILYFEYIKAARRIRIVCQNNCYEFSYVMEKLANELKESGFEVNCRGMLVNMRHIRKIKGYVLYMDNGEELALSQKRKAGFVKQMNVFMHNNL